MPSNTIALSKIARGFEADLEDVMFMLQQGLIAFAELENYFNAVLPYVAKTDIIVGYYPQVES